MAIYDITYLEQDCLTLDIIGTNGSALDAMFDNHLSSEIVGVNGTATEVAFDENTVNEIPSVMVTDFVFL